MEISLAESGEDIEIVCAVRGHDLLREDCGMAEEIACKKGEALLQCGLELLFGFDLLCQKNGAGALQARHDFGSFPGIGEAEVNLDIVGQLQPAFDPLCDAEVIEGELVSELLISRASFENFLVG